MQTTAPRRRDVCVTQACSDQKSGRRWYLNHMSRQVLVAMQVLQRDDAMHVVQWRRGRLPARGIKGSTSQQTSINASSALTESDPASCQAGPTIRSGDGEERLNSTRLVSARLDWSEFCHLHLNGFPLSPNGFPLSPDGRCHCRQVSAPDLFLSTSPAISTNPLPTNSSTNEPPFCSAL